MHKTGRSVSRRSFIKRSTTLAATVASGLVWTESSGEQKKMSNSDGRGKLKVAAVQMNALRDNLEHNLEVHRRIAAEAAGAGCELVVFPELSTTSHYGHRSATSLAQAADGGIFRTMSDLSKELNIHIAYGFCEIAHGSNYNSQALIGPEGLIGIHRKVHASRDEYTYFRMGRSLEVFRMGYLKVGILICYDANFFEAWRVLALKGAQIILLPHASRSGVGQKVDADKQKQSLKRSLDGLPGRFGLYAADNNVFAVFANQADYNGHSTHAGGAYILGPDQKVKAKSKPVLDDLWISAEIDLGLRDERRSSGNFILKDRRPELYGELTRMI
ncbi:carbon-nitrogen hydrolase family protein [candidate division KSB1 bacterium]